MRVSSTFIAVLLAPFNEGCSSEYSLDDDVEELVPVSWLETTETHGEAADLFDESAFEVELFHFLFVLLTQLNFNQALFNQVVEFVATQFLTASFVDIFAFLHDFSLFRIAVNHVGVEETTNFFVIVFKAFQD